MNENTYFPDILGDGFEQYTIPLKNDYEGKVVTTLIRHLSAIPTNKAILYIHGFNDYFFQKELAFQFSEKGYNFYAIDLRKYGRSYLPHQKFNDVRDIRDYFEDISSSLKIMSNEGNKHILLVGHSTGGLILTLFAKENSAHNLFDGLILNSPFYKFNQSSMVKLFLPLASFLGKIFPKITVPGGFTEQYGKSIHNNYWGEWDYDQNWKPNIAPKVNLGWVRAIYKAQKELRKEFMITKPVLVLHSEESATNLNDKEQLLSRDTILNVKDIEQIARKIKGNIEIKSIKGGLHDLILSKKDAREKVYTTIFDWMDRNNL